MKKKIENVVLLAVMLFMTLGIPFSRVASDIDRLALESYPSFKVERVHNGTVTEVTRAYLSVLDAVPYPGFEALTLRYLYITGQEKPVWTACDKGAKSSFFTSVRFYCYDLAWAHDRETAIQMGSAERFYYYDLFVYEQDPREYLTRVMLTAWRNGQIMRQAASLARSLNLQDVANLYNHTTQSPAY